MESSNDSSEMDMVVVLRNGVEIPRVGLGTWRLKGEECRSMLYAAERAGYNHFDTATAYGNEEELGSFLKGGESNDEKRSRMFVTSKVSTKGLTGADGVWKECYESLEKLQIEKLDLLLLHWPGSPSVPSSSNKEKEHQEQRAMRRDCWRGMERLYKAGATRSIGVSNYRLSHIKELLEDDCEILPMVNQLELHPLCFPQDGLLEFLQHHNIAIEAYASLGSGNPQLLSHPIVNAIAQDLGKTPGQVLLRWGWQKNFILLPKTKTEKRLEENHPRQLSAFQLTPDHIKDLDGISEDTTTITTTTDQTNQDHELHYCWDPRTVL